MTQETYPGDSTPPPRARRRRLGNLRNVKAYLADVLLRIDSGELDSKTGNALIYGSSTLAGVIEKEINTARLDDIEAQLAALQREVKP
ncbi:hypothetical protein [Anaeromyxobacter dehalogenans]|nr:hypothetical protein [Anaeromyxobacter dehalogenans]